MKNLILIVFVVLAGCKTMEMVHSEPMGLECKYDFYDKKENYYYSIRDTCNRFQFGDKFTKEQFYKISSKTD